MTEPNSDMAEKVVIYRLGTLGDTIVALPCFHQIARVFPNAARIILTNEIPSSAIAHPRLFYSWRCIADSCLVSRMVV